MPDSSAEVNDIQCIHRKLNWLGPYQFRTLLETISAMHRVNCSETEILGIEAKQLAELKVHGVGRGKRII